MSDITYSQVGSTSLYNVDGQTSNDVLQYWICLSDTLPASGLSLDLAWPDHPGVFVFSREAISGTDAAAFSQAIQTALDTAGGSNLNGSRWITWLVSWDTDTSAVTLDFTFPILASGGSSWSISAADGV